jgi:hypothetical protein
MSFGGISLPSLPSAISLGPIGGLIFDNLTKKSKSPEQQAQPNVPTMADAKESADYGQMKPKTYGRSGTVRNTGAAKGVASSLLNLSAPTLLGK